MSEFAILSQKKSPLLDSRYTGHLHGSLNCHAQKQTAERRSILEQLDIGLGLVLMLIGDTLLDLSILSLHPGVILVAVGMESSQGTQALIRAVVVNEPTGRLDYVSAKNSGRNTPDTYLREEHD